MGNEWCVDDASWLVIANLLPAIPRRRTGKASEWWVHLHAAKSICEIYMLQRHKINIWCIRLSQQSMNLRNSFSGGLTAISCLISVETTKRSQFFCRCGDLQVDYSPLLFGLPLLEDGAHVPMTAQVFPAWTFPVVLHVCYKFRFMCLQLLYNIYIYIYHCKYIIWYYMTRCFFKL